MRFFKEGSFNWRSLQDLPNVSFVCGYCNTNVSSVKGYKLGQHGDGSGSQVGAVYICPNCGGPVFFTPENQRLPSPLWETQFNMFQQISMSYMKKLGVAPEKGVIRVRSCCAGKC